MIETITNVIVIILLTLSTFASVFNIAVWGWVFMIAGGLAYLIGGMIDYQCRKRS